MPAHPCSGRIDFIALLKHPSVPTAASGAALGLAVTLNERRDYFGQTVNIASGV
jgi:hypothetical protein